MTAILLVAALSLGADPPVIRLPEVQVVTPQPAPAPKQKPGAATKLPRDRVYVIDCDKPVIVRAKPAGVVSIDKRSGPRELRERFIDGTGAKEWREFKGKEVYLIESANGGTVEIDVIPLGLQAESEIVTISLDVEAGEGPRPPPSPDVKPDPVKPEVDTNPFGVDDNTLRVLWFVDNSKPFPADQLSAIYGKATETYLASKKAVNRKYQPSEDGSRDEPAFARAAKLKRDSIPWVYVGRGKRGESVKCPDTPEAMLELLKKYGGE